MFTPQPIKRVVPPFGSKDARIAIVGDYTDKFDDRTLRPFSGMGGSVLEECLHAARLIKGEVYLTNLFKTWYPRKGHYTKGTAPDWLDEKAGKFSEEGRESVEELKAELREVQANVIVTLGIAPTLALLNIKQVGTYRGYFFSWEGRKVVPTLTPSSALRAAGHKYMIMSDLKKAKQESYIPELIRPDRKIIYNFSNVEEVLQWLEIYENASIFAFDIEVLNFEVACISFAADSTVGLVIPIQDKWTEDEELLIWRAIARVLQNPKSTKIAQNGIFDIQFLLARHGIYVQGELRDTMLAHSVMYPELPKGLGFLGSIYCGTQEYWKDTVKFNNIKGDS